MTLPRDFVAVLTFIMVVMMMKVCHCKADRPPPPRNLKAVWLDNFTVNVSWQEPVGLSDGDVSYKFRLETEDDSSVQGTKWRNFTERLLTEDTNSDRWTFLVWTVGTPSWNHSTFMNITIETEKPRAEVKGIRCLTYPNWRNCSWTPGSQSFNFSYRICGHPDNKSLETCDRPYSSATRNGCVLKAAVTADICVHVDFGNKSISFKPELEIHPPKMSVREEGDNLILSWTPPEIGKHCSWEYEVCYKRCNEPEVCREKVGEGEQMQIAYDRRCRYEFKSTVSTFKYCLKVTSDTSDVVYYGTTKPPDETLTVVAIVIPIILSVFIILSCYCFRSNTLLCSCAGTPVCFSKLEDVRSAIYCRHSSIICPIIPDPSAIFKEMMMNGNKELKTTPGSLYTPVPEPVEPCKITLVTENRENS